VGLMSKGGGGSTRKIHEGTKEHERELLGVKQVRRLNIVKLESGSFGLARGQSIHGTGERKG